MSEAESNKVSCPVCERDFSPKLIEEHVNKCIFLNTQSTKRNGSPLDTSSPNKKYKFNNEPQKPKKKESPTAVATVKEPQNKAPLAEIMRPTLIEDMVGQCVAFGPGSMLRAMLEKNKVPNMILWGPPGCGKTSLANIIATMCKQQNNLRFVKLSATTAGIGDVKEVVKVAKNESMYKRQTVLFMDEIHRFNKLQQDSFLPHVENGTIILIGATTENPSFSLNNALLSRCRVVVMEKLSTDDVKSILIKALKRSYPYVIVNDGPAEKNFDKQHSYVEESSLRWLSEVCDGDARFALGALELSLATLDPEPFVLTLQHVKDGIKRSHALYDRGGEEHYNVASALHKSVRASDDNAALYWCMRSLHGGEDPRFIARRLVRAAAEDIGLADPSALTDAVACMQGVQLLGMPESNVLLAQCAVRLARAPKSQEVYRAMQRAQRSINEAKGPLPSVPLHLRNAPTKLMKDMGYGKGYNLQHKDESGLTYMPEGMERLDFFKEDK